MRRFRLVQIMETQIYAIKSNSGEWRLKVLGNPWSGQNGGKDSDLEFFDTATKFHEDKFGLPVAVHYHGYDDSGNPSGTPEYIGMSVKRWVDSQGVWYEVILDQALDRNKELWNAALKGLLRASSGSVAHLVRKVKDSKLVNGLGQLIKRLTPGQYQDGHILEWPNVELSIFSIENGKRPANSYAVALPMTKAVYEQAGLVLPVDIGESSETDGVEVSDGSPGSDVEATSQQREVSSIKSEDRTMEVNEIQKLVADGVASALKAEQDKRNAEEAQKKAVAEQVEAAVKAVKDEAAAQVAAAKAEAAEARRLPGGVEAPHVAKFGNIAKYDNLDATDAAVLAGFVSAARKSGHGNGVSEDLRKYIAIQIAEGQDKDNQFVASKSARKMANMPMKANELNQSTLANYGDEWIGVTYSTQLWDKIRLAAPIVAKIPTISVPQGSESVVIPLNGTAPTFYKVAQASAQDANPGRVTPTITTTKKGTGSKTLTVSKLGAAINYTGELEEDSLIPWVSEMRRDLTLEAAEIMEHLVIDGDTDTSATTNINCIGGTPTGNEAYLLMNGFRKLALVTNTNNSRSAGTLTVEDYLETLKLMGLAGRNAAQKDQVDFIVDMWTHWKSLELAEVKSRDVFVAPTIENGYLVNLYGHNIITSSNMHRANQDTTYGLKANTSGKVDLNTAANNTTGSILAVRWDQWRLGYKRMMTFETQRDAISDSTDIVCMMRVGLINRDTEASAISYNVTL